MKERGSEMKTRSQSIGSDLALSWLKFKQSHSWEHYEKFATLLSAECARQVPDGRFNGCLSGAEAEVRQDALLMLLRGFLERNHSLAHPCDPDQVHSHLVKSVKLCVSYSVARMARQRSRWGALFSLGAVPETSEMHPCIRTNGDLSWDEKRMIALAALELAVKHNQLSRKNAQITRLLIAEGLGPSEVARMVGVSASAIHQQVRRVSAQLSVFKELVEW